MLRIALAALALLVAAKAHAEPADPAQYPNRAVRMIVPFPAGGTTDIYARVVADKLQAAFGQPFIVENKAGGTGILGTGFVANAPADGYTLVFGSNSSQVISPLLQPKQPYDALKDFKPISMLLYYPLYLLVNNDVPAKTVAELVALAKSKPGKLNMASIGTGSGGHLVIEMFKTATGIDTVHFPYRGVPAAQMGLMGGEAHFLFDSIAGSQTLVADGKLRGIAVTGRERSPVVPNVPTLKESGYDGFEDVVIWLGMLAPASTPDSIVKKLEAEMMRIARLPDVSKRIADSSSTMVGSTAHELAEVMRRETPVWAEIIKANNVRLPQ